MGLPSSKNTTQPLESSGDRRQDVCPQATHILAKRWAHSAVSNVQKDLRSSSREFQKIQGEINLDGVGRRQEWLPEEMSLVTL